MNKMGLDRDKNGESIAQITLQKKIKAQIRAMTQGVKAQN